MAFTVGVKLYIPQVENTRNNPKQVLHRMKICEAMQKRVGRMSGFKSERQHPTYIGVSLIKVDDLQGIFDSFPVISVIYGRHNGTLSLPGTAKRIIRLLKFFIVS